MNSNLSEQIRVFGFSRVTNSFNAKKFCDRRRYVYLLPVFALDPNAHPDRESVMKSVGSGNELVKCIECSERGRKVAGVVGRSFRFSKEEERSELEAGNGGFNVKIEKADLGDSLVSKEEERHEVEAGNRGQ
ncbi:tRNA pseudouridine synthase A, mitochondrial [Asparagus officinalis]|uniref:tRNA pseudouridine synthase A, mitochondrial n=1 Tax=Asparagus officinalis TaxID=4686 RepID=A0A5P1F365_ASPOF|nr:tRNA pseudouridine synthase A, mitochondrial [Asparagus officinalis]